MGKKKFTGPTKAGIYKSDKENWVRVVVPWNQDFLDELKDTTQPSFRKWEPEAKHWLINDIYLEDIILLCKKYFDEVETDLTSDEPIRENLFAQVFEVVPKEHQKLVYRALTQAIHPDHGGSNELMAQLNKAYEDTNDK